MTETASAKRAAGAVLCEPMVKRGEASWVTAVAGAEVAGLSWPRSVRERERPEISKVEQCS